MPDTDEVLSPAEEAKLDAEARKIEAEILAAEAAEARAQEKHQLELRKAELELKQLEVTVVKEEAYAAELRIRLNKLIDEEADRKALNKYYRVYNFAHEVTKASVDAAITQLTIWARQQPKCEIEIIFTSPGGSVFHGMALYDTVKSLRAQGHKITVTVLGYAASMAAILLQAGDVRRQGSESYVMMHEISSVAVGKLSELVDQVETAEKIQERILNIMASRATVTKQFLRKQWARKDCWLTSDEALKWGLVDEIF